MDVTTLDRMRMWVDEQRIDSYDSLMAAQITAFSGAIEKMLGRYLQSTARTTYCDVNPGDRVFWLKGYPMSAPSVYEDSARAFSGDAVDSSLYDYTQGALDEGRIEFDYQPALGPHALKVTYTGGLATTTAALITAYPGLVHACERQIWFDWNQRGMVGLDGDAAGDARARRQVLLLTWWQAHGGLLPEVWDVLRLYKSWVPRW